MKKTFREYLLEGEDEKFEKFVVDCSIFFRGLSPSKPVNVLYRGDRRQEGIDEFVPISRTIPKPTFDTYDPKHIVKSGRTPKDTKPGIHNIANEIFIEEFGYPFRDGMMATGSEIDAGSYSPKVYGKKELPFIFIPANGFEMCYSDTIGDFFGDIVDLDNLARKWLQAEGDEDLEDEYKEEFRKIIKNSRYVTGDEHLQDAIKSRHEVMFYPKGRQTLHYYLFTEDFWYEEVVPRLKKHFTKQ